MQLIDASRKKYDARLRCTSGDRYVTSDPIGLNGGLNTFGYVKANPLKYSDQEGLFISTESNHSFSPVNPDKELSEPQICGDFPGIDCDRELANCIFSGGDSSKCYADYELCKLLGRLFPGR